MTYLVHRAGRYVRCELHLPAPRGAFWVDDHVAHAWDRLVAAWGNDTPRNGAGFTVRPYPELNVASHAPHAPSGIYTDHRDPALEQVAYELRDRLGPNPGQATLRPLAEQYNMRHWRDMYNLIRNVGRRRTRNESGRDEAGELRWRRWNSSGWSRQAVEATAAVAARQGTRRFGIEVEFCHQGDVQHARTLIARAARNEGLDFTERWSSHVRDVHQPGWQGCYDCTVSGGEIISDILDGSDAALSQVSTILRTVRRHGGQAHAEQGMHVHHDASDFTVDDKLRLLDNLQGVERLLMAYVASSRRSNSWCRGADDYEWDEARIAIRRGHGIHCDRYRFFNLSHLTATRGARVEFRGLGHTLNGRKVRAWIRIGQAVMAATKAGERLVGLDQVGLVDALRRHGLSRWAADQYLARVGAAVGAAA